MAIADGIHPRNWSEWNQQRRNELTELIEQPDTAADEAAIPATDPPEDHAHQGQVTYAAIFGDVFDEVLTRISGVGNTRVNKQSQYRLKAADVASQLTYLAITRAPA